MIGDVVEFTKRVEGRYYRWSRESQNMVECGPSEQGAFVHKDWANHRHQSSQSSHRTYTYGHTRLFEGFDRKKWPRTWEFLLRFTASDDYNRNTTWKSEHTAQTTQTKTRSKSSTDVGGHIFRNGKWMTKAELEKEEDIGYGYE